MVTVTTTAVKRIRLAIMKVFHTVSVVVNPSGAISRKHIQTPQAQVRLMSPEDLRRITLIISGRLNKGKATEAIRLITCIIYLTPSILCICGMTLTVARRSIAWF